MLDVAPSSDDQSEASSSGQRSGELGSPAPTVGSMDARSRNLTQSLVESKASGSEGPAKSMGTAEDDIDVFDHELDVR